MQTGSYRIECSTGNMVHEYSVITVCGARGVLEISGETLYKVCDCLITVLYNWNQQKIILKINCN